MNFNILGIGLPQIVIIFAIMLIMFGPKKMVSWAYEAGRYYAKMRAMMRETMNEFQKEIQASGLDVDQIRKDVGAVSKDINTSINTSLPRFDILDEANKVVSTTAEAANANPNSKSADQTSDTTPKDDSEQESKYDAWLPK